MFEGLIGAMVVWRSCTYHWLGVCLFLLLPLLQCNGINSSYNCAIGVNTPGATIPKGDIILENGSSLEIFCNLNPNHIVAKGRNSSDLVFYRNEKQVKKEFVQVINSTTIRLFKKDPPVASDYYYCRLRLPPNETAVCLNKVAIGYKPQEVLNFTCISLNWQNLTCTWTRPENPVKTNYKLRFHLPGRAGARMIFNCPNSSLPLKLQNIVSGNQELCFWDQSTNPHYRQPYEYYYFSMTGENSLGTVQYPSIKFHHYSHVIPSQPVDLTAINETMHSLMFSWNVPFPMLNFPPGVIQKVEYQSQWVHNDSIWEIASTSDLDVHKSNHTYNLTGLPYANTYYDIRVYMRSPVAVGNDKWSQPATITMKTKPTFPGAPPLTDIGSFEVNICLPNRDVYIYWQYIPKTLENGGRFKYEVISVKEYGKEINLEPNELTNAYAKFKGISFNGYLFTIASVNEVGPSETFSEVYIPSKKESPPEPVSFTKIAFEGGTFELSWKPPVHDADVIESYTIFWCDNDRDRPYQCVGYLNWTRVPSHILIKNITVPEHIVYQFAISANTRNASSGMVWASCTVIPNRVMGKMKNVWINHIDSTFIEVGWKLDCSDRIGRVQGFRICYCPIVSPYNISCKEPVRQKDLAGDQSLMHDQLKGLKPYTTYMVSIAILTVHGPGQQSDPLYKTTLESVPDPPQNATVSNITNISFVLEWMAPVSMNGILRYYEVHYNDNVQRVESTNKLILENLTSHMTYYVSITACTVACSKKSEPIEVSTAIGIPGPIEHPAVRFINSTQVLVSWKPPLIPGGHLNYYQVSVQQSDDKKNSSVYYYNSTGNESQIPIPDCDQEGLRKKYTFMVRAVNIGEQNQTYLGPWSDPGENSCYNSGPPATVLAAIWVCGFIVITTVCIVFAYGGKRVWLRCKEMQDVEVKLPPGLVINPPDKEKDMEYHLHVSWPSSDGHDLHLTSGKSRSNMSADEELLLQNKEEHHGRNPSGDSSGCSSGHESVSSSLTSGTQISSDSGTEVDQHPPSPDGVFVESPPWDHRTSLRQRNVSALRSDADPYVKMGKVSVSVARSTPNLTDMEGAVVGYSCLGAWSSTGYISMPSSEEIGSSTGPETAPYCRIGLVDASPMLGVSVQQPQPPQVSPGKGYVILPNLMDTSSSGSSPQLSPQLQLSEGRGYVSHPLPWSSPKESSSGSGKGYVMAGEHLTDKSIPASLLSTDPGIQDDILQLEAIEGEAWSPDSYCRFGLRPIQITEEGTGVECSSAKPSSGYVTLDVPHPPDMGGFGGGSRGNVASHECRAGGSTGNYVPHRRFEKGDTIPLASTAFQDHVDGSYTTMSSADDANSPTTNV